MSRQEVWCLLGTHVLGLNRDCEMECSHRLGWGPHPFMPSQPSSVKRSLSKLSISWAASGEGSWLLGLPCLRFLASVSYTRL